VVGQHAFSEIGIEGRQRRQHLRPATWVRRDGIPLVGRERRPIVNDVEQRLVDLADVVKECDPLDGQARLLVKVGRLGQRERVPRDAAHMRTRHMIIRIDRVEQGFQRGSRESLGGAASRLLVSEVGAGQRAHGERASSQGEFLGHAGAERKKCTSIGRVVRMRRALVAHDGVRVLCSSERWA
jgi:hypothetical protein